MSFYFHHLFSWAIRFSSLSRLIKISSCARTRIHWFDAAPAHCAQRSKKVCGNVGKVGANIRGKQPEHTYCLLSTQLPATHVFLFQFNTHIYRHLGARSTQKQQQQKLSHFATVSTIRTYISSSRLFYYSIWYFFYACHGVVGVVVALLVLLFLSSSQYVYILMFVDVTLCHYASSCLSFASSIDGIVSSVALVCVCARNAVNHEERANETDSNWKTFGFCRSSLSEKSGSFAGSGCVDDFTTSARLISATVRMVIPKMREKKINRRFDLFHTPPQSALCTALYCRLPFA